MIATIFIVSLAFLWLTRETECFTIRLLVGPYHPNLASYKVYQILRTRKPSYSDSPIHEGGNLPEGYRPNGEPVYQVVLSPGVASVLCGFDWLDQHCADMVEYQPQVSMTLDNVRYAMRIKDPSVIKDVMKANHMTKKEKAAMLANC